ncbi:probable BOI-related E3 ubiquitin-protein ligase 2 [Durio zibethinus]|uniref:Probable BOI-related E3 ubiquitin-protein ligase 2 n=1 Tax=Durio zibethinus TaxID=66656 RepID=A0A6P5ZHI2_DURZI|nr:probable BOI-related E3 ubiquitin-protein ligase 2 [Durio zibethinus]
MAVQAQLYPENMSLPLPMGLQDWMVNTAPAVPSFEADFCFSLHDPSQQMVPFHPQQYAQNLASAASSSSSSKYDAFLSVALSQSLDAQLEMQRQELDCILQLQNERLRSALREQRKRQLAILLKSMESKALYLMRRKDEDLAKATKKTMELEASLRKAEMEIESWQRLSKANEATVMDLSNTLEQVRESLVWVSNTAEDAESLFYGSCDTDQQGEVKDESKKMACKHCNSRSSCVLFLPCRHLCSCKSCDAFLDSCPVCKSVKEASMKVFWV